MPWSSGIELSNRAFENYYPDFTRIVDLIFSSYAALLLSIFYRQVLVFPGCFTEVVCVSSNEPACDPVIIGATMFIGKTVHESVNALTLEDEKRTAACPVFRC